MIDRRAKDTWTVFKIIGEFVEGFESLRPVWPSVSIFGSARTVPGHRYHDSAVCVGEALSRAGFSVITGGGPGLERVAVQSNLTVDQQLTSGGMGRSHGKRFGQCLFHDSSLTLRSVIECRNRSAGWVLIVTWAISPSEVL